MSILYNDDKIIKNKKYYHNVIVKLKNNPTILSLSLHTIFNLNSITFQTRFFKIKSFHNNIDLQYIIKLISYKFPDDIINNIIKYYVQDNVSFFSIKRDKTYNTMKYTTNISNDNSLDTSESDSKENNIMCDLIVERISKHLKNLLNSKKNIDINNIFLIKDDYIDYCFNYKIYSTKNAWGIEWKNN